MPQGFKSFRAVFGSKWCYGVWPVEWTAFNIAFLEFYPIVLSLSLWVDQMRNRCILFLTDNESLVKKQSCKDKQLMIFFGKLVLICLKYNILFKQNMYQGPSYQGPSYLVCSSRNSPNQYHLPWVSRPRRSPASPTAELEVIVSTLIQSSSQPSSIPTYRRAWKLFHQLVDNFSPCLPVTMPVSPSNLALFVAYLYQERYASSAVNTYVSTLGYSHRLTGFIDPTKVFFIVQILKDQFPLRLLSTNHMIYFA